MRRYETFDDWGDSEALLEAQEIEAGLSTVLADSEEATPGHVDRLLSEVLAPLTPVERESIGSALSALGSSANVAAFKQFAGQAMPAVGTAVGAVYGGPAGAAVGGAVGQAAGRAFGGGKRPSAPAPAAPAMSTTATAPSPQAGGTQAAAGQLLYLIQNPTFLASLLGLAMGAQGRATVPVGGQGTEVPVGAFMNLLSTLAGRATQEADALASDSAEEASTYLQDCAGRFICDPAVPEQRAHTLLQLLEQEDEDLADDPWDASTGEDW